MESPFPPACSASLSWKPQRGSNFMSEIGVNWFTRKFACAVYPVATNLQNPDGSITINTQSSLKSSTATFRLGVPFEEDTADGSTFRTTATVDQSGTKLIKVQDGQGVYPSRIETREFVNNCATMVLTHVIPNNPKFSHVKSVRTYKRQPTHARRKRE